MRLIKTKNPFYPWSERRPKRTIAILLLALLVASIVGVVNSFSLPVEAEEITTRQDYQHCGEFDYQVYLKPSYLYDTTPLITDAPVSPVPPRYPLTMVDTCNLFFTYHFVTDEPVGLVREQVEIVADVETGEGSHSEVILVPETAKVGDFTLKLPLDTIDLVKMSRLTVNAYVYTIAETESEPILDIFITSLTVNSDGRILEFDNTLTSKQVGFGRGVVYEQQGIFGYEVIFKPSSVFGMASSKPLQTVITEEEQAFIQEPGETIFTKLVDRIVMNFACNLESTPVFSDQEQRVRLSVLLENPDYWRKEFKSKPYTIKEGDVVVSIPLDMEEINDSIRTIEQETGITGLYNIEVKAEVHTLARSDIGGIDENYEYKLAGSLERETLLWDEELTEINTGTLESRRIVANPARYLGLSVNGLRILTAVFTSIFLLAFSYSATMYIGLKPQAKPEIEFERQAQGAIKKYKDIIVEVEELPPVKSDETVISIGSLEHLVRAAEEVLKPVLYKAEKGKHIYCALDGLIRYQYVSQLESFYDNQSEWRG